MRESEKKKRVRTNSEKRGEGERMGKVRTHKERSIKKVRERGEKEKTRRRE